jgi:hypothetical protein
MSKSNVDFFLSRPCSSSSKFKCGINVLGLLHAACVGRGARTRTSVNNSAKDVWDSDDGTEACRSVSAQHRE